MSELHDDRVRHHVIPGDATAPDDPVRALGAVQPVADVEDVPLDPSEGLPEA